MRKTSRKSHLQLDLKKIPLSIIKFASIVICYTDVSFVRQFVSMLIAKLSFSPLNYKYDIGHEYYYLQKRRKRKFVRFTLSSSSKRKVSVIKRTRNKIFMCIFLKVTTFPFPVSKCNTFNWHSKDARKNPLVLRSLKLKRKKKLSRQQTERREERKKRDETRQRNFFSLWLPLSPERR